PQIPNAEYRITEGDTLNVTHGFTDPDSTSWTVTADYGNGPVVVSTGGATTFPLSKLYPQDSSDQPGGFFRIELTVTDEHGNSASALVKVFVENALEQPNVGGNATIPVGGSINRTVTFVDPGADSPWSVTVNYGDGTVETFTNADKDFPIGHSYSQPGTYRVTVTVNDDDTSRSNFFDVTVNKPNTPTIVPPWVFFPPTTTPPVFPPVQPPVSVPGAPAMPWGDFIVPQQGLILNTPYYGGGWMNSPPEVYFDYPGAGRHPTVTIKEGDPFIEDGHIIDPNGDPVSAFVDYGDGSGWQPLPLFAGNRFTLNHNYFPQEGEYEVRVKAIDIWGAEGINTLKVKIVNVVPTIEMDGDRKVETGKEAKFSGTFKDPGADTWTATVDYGDGSKPEAVTLNGKSFKMGHKYSKAGTYKVTIKIFDGTDYGVAQFEVEVTDPMAPMPGPMQPAGGDDMDLGVLSGVQVDDFFASYGADTAADENAGGGVGLGSMALALGLAIPLFGAIKVVEDEKDKQEAKKRKKPNGIGTDGLDEFFGSFGRN
ncbi:MAG: PKD domain-containing protein, partial [Candidatus Obscuribacterales bacterium]|nr:PKD domain-containing protein [Candidatus Obscuribacterales bacterium]